MNYDKVFTSCNKKNSPSNLQHGFANKNFNSYIAKWEIWAEWKGEKLTILTIPKIYCS